MKKRESEYGKKGFLSSRKDAVCIKHGNGAARAQKGETLVEILVSLLVVVLAALLLASIVTNSARINLTVREMDEKFYEALSQVEAMSGTGTATQVTITKEDGSKETVDVEVFPSDPLAAYKEKVS